ncbi:EF-hand domain-containing protein [Undibacterium sp. TS12]|uniref:EF-hand domain-containing protein n=1 Tax=Undibacterium sp. TS12 TaxID=2908202 RepID=UPI001F4CEF2B|nr:EF-hand domain-containing protein [Undibacterium sp. TS12]MCH8617486.1 EF-hand domain-containing protein [Undibacterium sp. TS12]
MSVNGIGGAGGARAFDPSAFSARIVKKFDSNGDGSLDKDEFVKGLTAKGISAEDAAKKFDEIDTQKTGKITQADIEADIKSHKGDRPHGGKPPEGAPPAGGPGGAGNAGGASGASSTKTYDAKDLNKDGTVSAAEELVYEITQAVQSAKATTSSSTVSATSSSQKLGNNVDVQA